LDSLSAGYRTILIDDCCRGVDLTDIEATKEGILSNHGIIVQSNEVNNRERKKNCPKSLPRGAAFPLHHKNHNSLSTSDETFVALTAPQFNGWDMI
jgi:hypothetical protein